MSSPAIPAGTIAIPAENAPAPPAAAAPGACASCGASLLGDFCHACGERRLQPDEMTVQRFARDVAEEVGNLDSRAYRTLRYLLARPGFLTAEWVAGRRRAYVGPLKLYIVTFAVMMLLATIFQLPDPETVVSRGDGAIMEGVVGAIAERHDLTPVQAVERTTETILAHTSWWHLLRPVLLAVVLMALFAGRGRTYVEHLVFATHLGAFEYLTDALLVVPMQPLLRSNPAVAGVVIAAVSVGVLGVYMLLALQRVYGDRGWSAWLRTAALYIAYNLSQAVAGFLALGSGVAWLLYG
ncbi:MAG TPA: DUF3667 domain-containing protein [Longimicrobium sp.]|nr:DUF3667 domain-containing protein [Longimicrobium sp.]